MSDSNSLHMRAPDQRFQVSADSALPEVAAEYTAAPAPGAQPPRHNLPAHLTRFIGREKVIDEVKAQVSEQRLVTLIGLGGAGKTRLSQQVAHDLLDAFPGGAWFVELAPITEAALIAQTVATTLGVHEEAGKPIEVTLFDRLCALKALLILDNCEHLVQAAAQSADGLLRHCPDLHLMASSREGLGIAGEVVYRVPPLTTPDPGHLPALDTLAHYEAVQLFVDRAASVKPGFTLTDQNAAAVAQICARLDGIPLAIELAAARVKVLTPQQIADRLDHLFHLLTRGSTTALPRHQTLRAAVDWSYELLPGAARLLLRRLSVFAADFSLTAAEAICAGPGLAEEEILDTLTDLVEHSLITVSESEPLKEARYRLLEMIRQYGQEKLEAAGEAVQVRDRHLAFFLRLAEEAEPKLQSEEQGRWLGRLEIEHHNFRTALEWSKSEEQNTELGLRMAGALWRFWEIRGYLAEGRAQLESALARGAGAYTPARAKALVGAGSLVWHQKDIARATAFHEAALAVQRELGDQPGIAFSLNNLGVQAFDQGELERAAKWFEESLALSRELEDRRMAGYALHNLGNVVRHQDNLRRASDLYHESLSFLRELGDTYAISITLCSLGVVTQQLGEIDRAASYLEEGLALCLGLGAKPIIAVGLEGLAGVALARQQSNLAAQLLGAAEALRQATHFPPSPVDRLEYDRMVAGARAVLGKGAFEDAWLAGQSMAAEGWEKVIAYALAQPASGQPHHVGTDVMPATLPSRREAAKQKYGGLTAKEREVAALVAQGKSNREIAAELFVGLKTVEAHISSCLSKLGFTSRAQIAAWAVAKGLAEAPTDLDTLGRDG